MCVESVAMMALPVSPTDVVIMRVMIDRGDLEINLVLKHWELGVGGRHIYFSLSLNLIYDSGKGCLSAEKSVHNLT